ncbi:MAG TPA: antibiotic biosynthesis monooxygenase [Lachnospiraceae bacterium]|nr:antibiotic biosynthesis monooxygenase [Lachnospiraceae bacterium]
MKEFDSEFANVCFQEKDNVVFLTWKKEAHLEDYRKPALFALELLRANPFSNFVVDARNGFEDDKRDVEWGFQFLLPSMAETSCKFICFIMNEVNQIEEEMDMWTVEFGKYFAVTRASDYLSAISSISEYVLTTVKYKIKEGKREEFIKNLTDNRIADASKKEPGNIKYEILLPIESSNEVCLLEMWTNQHENNRHKQTKHYQVLAELKAKYVERVEIINYMIKKIK